MCSGCLMLGSTAIAYFYLNTYIRSNFQSVYVSKMDAQFTFWFIGELRPRALACKCSKPINDSLLGKSNWYWHKVVLNHIHPKLFLWELILFRFVHCYPELLLESSIDFFPPSDFNFWQLRNLILHFRNVA